MSMENLNFVETRHITLPKGGVLEIQMTQELLDRIKYQFGVDSTRSITDDHVRMFIWGTVNNAVDKAEQEAYNEKFTGQVYSNNF